ncbi:peptide chain release factor N(5)-glutamine methyltransferase [Gudongella sp. DL1XJH-153]|uniref:peptide chain release factor N(5)-glutamine methyltransferase n=1 Tax=Gudongella sp. DL1XJH-153 TaxID=3409804 RepID=UPI003BB60BA9
MVIDQLLNEGIENLRNIQYSNPQLEVRLILSRLLEVDKSYLYAYGDREVSEQIIQEFRSWIQKRVAGYPLQYLLGTQEFMGMELEVSEGVLIPRGDTEILVEYLLDYIRENFGDDEFTLLDIGIGSGAISLAIAKLCPKSKVYGVDFYDKPLALAKRNMERLGLHNATYFKGDLFSPFEGEHWSEYFNIVVSNPPYIPEGDKKELQSEVGGFEPETALFGGKDGLDFYRRITQESKGYLKKRGLLAYEIGHDQGDAVSEIMRKEGFGDVIVKDDLESRNRVVAGKA